MHEIWTDKHSDVCQHMIKYVVTCTKNVIIIMCTSSITLNFDREIHQIIVGEYPGKHQIAEKLS